MRFFISNKQEVFFQNSGFVEFNDLLSEKEVADLQENILLSLESKTGKTRAEVLTLSPYEIYLLSRDLHRTSPVLRKIASRMRFAEIAAKLSKQKRVQLAFDQVLYSPSHYPSGDPLLKLLDGPLSDVISYQGPVCALAIKLTNKEILETPYPEKGSSISPIPQKAGNGIFFNPKTPLDIIPLLRSHDLYYLVVYASDKLVYTFCRKDPLNQELKKLGYNFSDKLRHNTHPFVYREIG